MKVLLTCPPMIQRINHYFDLSQSLGIELIIPEFEQTVPREMLLELVTQIDGWIIGDDTADSEILSLGYKNKLKAIIKWGIGTDAIDLKSIERFNIKFSNTPNAFGDEVADLAIGYLVSLSRQIHIIDQKVRIGEWYKPSGISLRNRNAAIIGFGNIGHSIAMRLNAMGLNINYFDPNVFSDEYKSSLSMEDAVISADFIFLACALNERTRYIINDKLINSMKQGVYIINVSRGGLINEIDLIQALSQKKVRAVALDVFESEPIDPSNKIFSFEGCIFGSHNASNTQDAVDRVSQLTLHKIKSFLSNQ